MKNILLLFLISFFIISCQTSPIKVMKENTDKYIRSFELIPDSYKPARLDLIDTITVREVEDLKALKINEIENLNIKIDSLEVSEKTYDFVNSLIRSQKHSLLKKYKVSRIKDLPQEARDNFNNYKNETYRTFGIDIRKFLISNYKIRIYTNEYLIDSLNKLLLFKTKNNPILLYKVYHVYEAKDKSGNLIIQESNILFDCNYEICSFEIIP